MSIDIPAGQRERLERVCRYALRPPVAPERLTLTADGQVRLALGHAWADGTTHVQLFVHGHAVRVAGRAEHGEQDHLLELAERLRLAAHGADLTPTLLLNDYRLKGGRLRARLSSKPAES